MDERSRDSHKAASIMLVTVTLSAMFMVCAGALVQKLTGSGQAAADPITYQCEDLKGNTNAAIDTARTGRVTQKQMDAMRSCVQANPAP